MKIILRILPFKIAISVLEYINFTNNLSFKIVALVAEYDADVTIQELKRRLVKSGKIKKQGKKMLYVENLMLTVADQKCAVHMSEILFELGRNIVANISSSRKIGNIAILPVGSFTYLYDVKV